MWSRLTHIAQAPGTAAANDGAGLAAVEFDQLSLVRQGQRILDRLTFAIAPGELVLVVGNNGAGKSALLDSLVDGRAVEAGSLRVFGHDIDRLAARRSLAWLEAGAPTGDGHQWLAQLGRLFGCQWSRAATARLAADHGQAVEVLDQAAAGLSRARLRGLGLVAAVASGRPVLLLDDPLDGLDPATAEYWANQFRQARCGGRTLFVATRTGSGLVADCDRLLFLDRGQLVFAGSPRDLVASTGIAAPQQALAACLAAAQASGLAAPAAARTTALPLRATPGESWVPLLL